MAIVDCPECTHKISDQSVSCTQCGFPTPKTKVSITCPECFETTSNQGTSCDNCGFPMTSAPCKTIAPHRPMNKNNKSKEVATLFALLLGGIGIYKAYFDQASGSYIYVLLYWTFIPLVIAIFEAIILSCTNKPIRE